MIQHREKTQLLKKGEVELHDFVLYEFMILYIQ